MLTGPRASPHSKRRFWRAALKFSLSLAGLVCDKAYSSVKDPLYEVVTVYGAEIHLQFSASQVTERYAYISQNSFGNLFLAESMAGLLSGETCLRMTCKTNTLHTQCQVRQPWLYCNKDSSLL